MVDVEHTIHRWRQKFILELSVTNYGFKLENLYGDRFGHEDGQQI